MIMPQPQAPQRTHQLGAPRLSCVFRVPELSSVYRQRLNVINQSVVAAASTETFSILHNTDACFLFFIFFRSFRPGENIH